MLTTTADRAGILLPQYQDVVIEQRARDYLVDGESYRRVSSVLGIINKPALVGWARNTTLERVEEILRNPDVQGGLADIFAEKPGTTTVGDYGEWVERVIASGKKAADQKRDTAADRGTSVHEEIRAVLEGTQPGERVISPQTDQALQFLADKDYEITALEMPVWNDDLEVAGTCDAVGVNRFGHPVVWDWKTGSGPWWEMALQLGAYASMLTRLTGEPVTEAFVVKLLPEDYEIHWVSDLNKARDAFEHAVHLQAASKNKWWV